jgi:hypothetical protein
MADLLSKRDSTIWIFEGIGYDQEFTTTAIDLARTVTSACSRPLLFVQRTRLEIAISRSVGSMGGRTIVCVCEILLNVLRCDRRPAASHLMASGAIHTLNALGSGFPFIAVKAFADVLGGICYYGSTADVEEVLRMEPIQRFISVAEAAGREERLKWIERGLNAIAKMFVAHEGKLSDGSEMVTENDMEALANASDGDEASELLISFYDAIRGHSETNRSYF